MSKNLFAKAVQDAALGSEGGSSTFRGTCNEILFFEENIVDAISNRNRKRLVAP